MYNPFAEGLVVAFNTGEDLPKGIGSLKVNHITKEKHRVTGEIMKEKTPIEL